MASADIGDLGPTDGRPVTYVFRSYYHVQGLLPWIVLGAMFFGFRRNRSWPAAWIWLPVIAMGAGFELFKSVMRVPSGSGAEMNVLFTALVGGFAAMWLAAHRLERLSFPVTVLVLHGLYLGFMGITLFGSFMEEQSAVLPVLTSIMILPILWGLVLARRLCRDRFHGRAFFGWFVLGVFTFALLAAMTALTVHSAVAGARYDSLIADVAAFAAIFTVIAAVGGGAFLLLLLNQPFWRARFEGVFKLGLSERPGKPGPF